MSGAYCNCAQGSTMSARSLEIKRMYMNIIFLFLLFIYFFCSGLGQKRIPNNNINNYYYYEYIIFFGNEAEKKEETPYI